MSDSDKPKDPHVSGAGSFPPAPAEAELDTALAAAADLAAGLAKEVRESDPPIPRTSAKDERLALDQELAELERLTHKAAEDLGAEPPAPPPKKKKKRAPPAVPDFMSEFTGPTTEAGPFQADDRRSAASPDAADTVMGELLADPQDEAEKNPPLDPTSLGRSGSMSAGPAGKVGVQVPADRIPPPAAQTSTAGSAAMLAEAEARQALPVAAGRAAGVVGNIENPLGKTEPRRRLPEPQREEAPSHDSAGIGRALYPAAERLVGVLEILDKPFTWIGQPLRQVIGWFAVATILTSLLVLAVAMFT